MTTRQRLHRSTSPARRPAAALTRRLPAVPLLLAALALLAVLFVGAPPAQAQSGHPAPQNVQVVPGDGTLTVTWDVSPRDGFDDHQIRHALRWSQAPGVWANPEDPDAGGREDGIPVDGGVYSYTITGLQNDVATGVFVRSFTGGSLSERSPHSSPWVRIKGDSTTPTAPVPQEQTPPDQQAQSQQQAQSGVLWSATLTVKQLNQNRVGCRSSVSGAACDALLSDNSFSLEGADYSFSSIQLTPSTGALFVNLSAPGNSPGFPLRSLSLYVGNTAYSLSGVTLGNPQVTIFTGQSWSDGDVVPLSLRPTTALPALLGKQYAITPAGIAVEGESASLEIALGENAPTGGLAFTVTPNYQTGAGKASSGDVGAVPSTVTVPAGSKTQSFSIPTNVDFDDEGGETFHVIAATSVTGWSPKTTGANVAMVILRDFRTAGVRGVAVTLNVNEGATGQYRVWLNSRPSADVTVTPSSSDAGAVSLTPSTLTFTAANWAQGQAVTVTGVQDADANDETVTITHSVSSSDPRYRALTPASATVNVNDDDTGAPTTPVQPTTPQSVTLWSATLTVTDVGGLGPIGCNDSIATTSAKCSTLATLTDTTFTYNNVNYQVQMFVWSSGSIIMRFDRAIPSAFDTLTLHVGNSQLAFADGAKTNSGRNVVWSVPTAPFAVGDTVSLSIQGSPQTLQSAVDWTSTLTVKFLLSAATGHGCTDGIGGEESCSNSLTDRDFTYETASYLIHTLRVSGAGNLLLTFDKAIPNSFKQNLVLNVGNAQFAFADATVSGATANWANSGLTWATGDTVSLGLTPAPTTVQFAATSLQTTEGVSVDVTVNIAPPLEQESSVLVTASGSSALPADLNADYTLSGLSQGRLTLPAGAATATFTVHAVWDEITEGGNEEVFFRLSAVPGAPYDLGSDDNMTVLIWDTSQTTSGPPEAPFEFALEAGDGQITASWFPTLSSPLVTPPQRRLDAPTNLTLYPDPVGNGMVTWSIPLRSDGVTGYEVHYKQTDAPDRPSFDCGGADGHGGSCPTDESQRPSAAPRIGHPETGWVDVSAADGGVVALINNTFMNTGTSYDVRVRALKGDVPGPWSDTLTRTFGPPADGEFVRGVSGYELRFRESTLIDRLYPIGDDPDRGWVRVFVDAEDASPHVIDGLDNYKRYNVQARAWNAFGYGGWAGPLGAEPADPAAGRLWATHQDTVTLPGGAIGCDNSATNDAHKCYTLKNANRPLGPNNVQGVNTSNPSFTYYDTYYYVEEVTLKDGVFRLRLDKDVPEELRLGGYLTMLVGRPDVDGNPHVEVLELPGDSDFEADAKLLTWSGVDGTWSPIRSNSKLIQLFAHESPRDPQISLSVSPGSVAEGGSATVTVAVQPQETETLVTVTLGGDARYGEDYTVEGQTVHVLPGGTAIVSMATFLVSTQEGFRTFTINATSDAESEAAESITMNAVIQANGNLPDAVTAAWNRDRRASTHLTITENIGAPADIAISDASGGAASVTWAAPAGDGPAPTGYDVQYKETSSGAWLDAGSAVQGPDIWSATLNVKHFVNVGSWGCVTLQNDNAKKCSTADTLTDNTFDIDGTTFTIVDLTLNRGTLRKTLVFYATPPSNYRNSHRLAKYLLYVDGEAFHFSPTTGDRPVWTADHLDWKTGDVVQLRLAPLGSQEVTGLTDGAIYDVRVRARAAQGAGPWAALDFPGAPGQPSRELGSGRLDVSWNIPSDTGNSAITGYDVQYRDTTSDTWVDAGRAGAEGKALWDARLKVHADSRGRNYGCANVSTALADCTERLTDVNFEHQGAKYTIERVFNVRRDGSITIRFDRAVTQALRDSVILLVDGAAYLPLSAGDWAEAGNSVVLRSGALGWSNDQLVRLRLAVLTHPITGLTDGATYEVRLRAVNDAGPGPWSPSTFGTPGAARPGDTTWEAELAVKQTGGTGAMGCKDDTPGVRCSAQLSDNTIVHGGVEYQVVEVLLQTITALGNIISNVLYLDLGKAFPESLKTFVLLVDGRPFSLAAATYSGSPPDTAVWDIIALGEDLLQWQVGEVVDLRLVPYQPPGVPTSIALRPGYDEAIVTWVAPADAGHSAIHNYQVRYKPYASGRDAWRIRTSDPGRHGLRISGLTPDTWYDVQVRAVNLTAGPGEWSITHSVRTNEDNDIILHTTRTTLNEGGPAATVTVTIPVAWTRDGWARLSVSPCSNAEQPQADCNADFEVQGFDPNFAEGGPVSKTFTVRALNDADAEPAEYFVISVSGQHIGEDETTGGWSEPLLFTIAENISAPADLAVSDVSGGAASVTWAAPAGDGPAPTGYDVQYKEASSGNWRDAGRVGVDAVWSATLTARAATAGNTIGCGGTSAPTCAAQLTDDDFVVNGTTYSIDRLYFSPEEVIAGTTFPPAIVLVLDRAVTDDVRSLALVIDGQSFPLANARYRAVDFPRRLDLRNPGLSWSDGDTVSLSLAPAPSQQITGLTDGAIYDVRVRAVYDSGPGPWSPTASSGGGQGGQGSQNSPGSGGGSPGSEGDTGAVPNPGQLEPYNVQVTPGDGTLTVTWSVAPRDGFENDQIKHALRWSQVSGVWANPPGPSGAGENGIAVEGGVTTYVITGLTNDVATGVFVRSFVGGDYSERSERSSKWVRIKGDDTTPTAGQPPQQQQQATPKTFSVSATAGATEGGNAVLTVTLSEAAPAEGVTVAVIAEFTGHTAQAEDVGSMVTEAIVSAGNTRVDIAIPLVDDRIDEDDETFAVSLAVPEGWEVSASGTDTATVTITDDDTAGVTVTPTTLSVAEDGSAGYTVVLDSRPTDDVFVLPLGNDDGASYDALPLVFSPENWYTPQTITVSGADDADSNDESVGITHEASSGDPKYHRIPVSSVSVTVTDDDTPAQEQQQTPAESEPPTPGQLEPYNIQITPGDGTLTVTWTVAPRDGFENDQIRHALRWSQEPGVWANPLDPNAGGREDGIAVEGGVYSYTITGLQNGVATGVFIRSFTGNDHSERASGSSQWVRIKGDDTTPQEGL